MGQNGVPRTIVCAPNHQYTIVLLETINFVQEVASDVLGDQAVKIFEDEKTWCGLPRFLKDGSDFVVIW